MSKIAYDPVKDRFAGIIRHSRWLRRIFYFVLDLFFLRSWHIRRILREMGKKMDQKGEWKLLDAGCGFGQYDRFILSQFKNVKVHSIDVKEDYLEDNRHYFRDDVTKDRIQFYEADLLEFSSEEKFDFVICIDVLEHIEDDVTVMRNLQSGLKNGGHFLMHSPSHYSEEDADEDDSFVGEHARTGYSKEEITAKLESAGLSSVKPHYTYGFWGHAAWVLSVKWPMIWFTNIKLLAVLPLLIYYPVVMPVCLLMNFADLYTRNEKGTGIYALARKS
ncbi:class I SAM-dependent methyltransferase [Rhodohalobacter sp. 614A]|uniref:class I SAM-dependent methyltransferase n=1 Tax=Rhodohalobacter sp. 614A TaxID=2908649 RepID=UPI001F388898|nr:class I SAM-dependent methyltransferase [Rhodohalobacter sp. 614A]